MKTTTPLSLLVVMFACGCSGSDGKSAPPFEPPTPTELGLDETAPGVVVVVESLTGASGPGGAFLPGDRPAVRFRLEKANGDPWALAEMISGAALCSGPTKNYQRVLPLADDVVASASARGDGSWTYRFAPLPAVYAAPYNDTPAFGADAGELTGEPLLEGTYTLGLSFAWGYTVDGAGYLDVGEATVDVRLGGGAGALAPRRVTQAENCNRCHVSLEAHAGRHRELTLCLMCHTSGAEDRNDPAIEGGTPGVTIDSRILFHKIHNGAHLPSVIGIGVNPDGSLDYGAAPKPFRVVGADGTVHDYSAVGFPAWPNRTVPMPLAPLYGGLSDAAKAKEDRVRTGVTSCYLCHFDPDGDGPIEAPADGELIHAQLTRKACGACHDDVIWEQEYLGDLGLMDPQLDDATCQDCHAADPLNPLGTPAAHLHPLRDPAFNTGVVVELIDVAEAGASDGDGTLEPGEKVAVTLAVTNGAGAPIAFSELAELRVAIAGPHESANALHSAAFPPGLLTGFGPVTHNVPAQRNLEFLGDSTGALGDVFVTARAPHYALAAAPTTVGVRFGFGAGITLASTAAARGQNYLDVDSTAGFKAGDFLVVADGTADEEYLQVQLVDGARLWFSSPDTPEKKAGLERAHPAGTTVIEVVLALKTAGVDYALDAATGTLTELAEFGAGAAVLGSYTTDFVVPDVHPAPWNDSPDVGAALGDWGGLALVGGTYTVSAWASLVKAYNLFGTFTDYRLASEAASVDVLVGGALTPTAYGLIDDPNACNACHQDIQFHDGRARGYASCLACHGGAGAEDQARYVSPNGPPTPGARVDLRSLVHRIHGARLLFDPAAFELVGEGPDAYPDNFAVSSFASILFPAHPGASKACAKCHGAANAAWQDPAPRVHPDPLVVPIAAWRAVCAACHDAPAQIAHMAAQTAPDGTESCAVCHATGEELSVLNVHRPR
jgi:hypothetical protein